MRAQTTRKMTHTEHALWMAAGLVAVAAVFLPLDAAACLIPEPTPFETSDEEPAEDADAPERVEAEVVDVVRGKAPQKKGNLTQVGSCDDIGQITVEIEDPAEDVGYDIEFVDGTKPEDNFELPDEPVRAKDGQLVFAWSDGASDEQETFDFRIRITAVDRWDQRAEPSEPLRISHAGDLEMDCATPGFYQVRSMKMFDFTRTGGLRLRMCR